MAKKFAFTGTGETEAQADGTMSFRLLGVISGNVFDTVPDAPQGFRVVEFSDTYVEIAWNDAADTLTWKVYRDDVLLDTVAVPTYTDNSVVEDTDYVYHLIPVNGVGDGTQSVDLPVHTALQLNPDVPTGLQVSENGLSAGFVALEWDDLLDATEWEVYRDGALLATTVVPRYTDSVVAASTTYSYRVLARNSTGVSALCPELIVITPENSAPEWNIPDQTATQSVAYSLDLRTVCQDFDGDPLTFTIASGSVPGLTITSNGNFLGGAPTTVGTHVVVLRADDGFVTTDESVTFTVSAVADTTAPAPPTLVSAVALGSTVTLTWTAATDASGISSYRVRRNGTLIASNLDPALLTYDNLDVPNGTHSYEIRAVDNSPAQNVSASSNSLQVVVNVSSGIPDVPVYAQPTVISSSQINHSWAAGSSGATPTGYDLDRATSSGGPWTVRFSNRLSPLTYSDTGLSANTQYFYRLRALTGANASAYVTRNATTSQTSGLVWPGRSGLEGGVPWRTGPGSVYVQSGFNGFATMLGTGTAAASVGNTGFDLCTGWTGKSFLKTWANIRAGGSGSFETLLSLIPDDIPICHIVGWLPVTENANPTRWDQMAAGDYDVDLNECFRAMRVKVNNAGRDPKTIIFDFNHELTGTWYAWELIDGKTAQFKAAWEHVVRDIVRVHFPTSYICIRPARRQGGGSRSITLNQLLPANDTFDLIGRSMHDENVHVNRNTPSTWLRHIDKTLAAADNNIGMEHVAEECRARGKKLLMAEWGSQVAIDPGSSHQPNETEPPVNGIGYFYEKAYEWYAANQDIMFAETVFQPSDSKLWGTRSNPVPPFTASNPQDDGLSARHEAGKLAYSASSRWGQG